MFQTTLTKINKKCHLSDKYKKPQNILEKPQKKNSPKSIGITDKV